jgi:hypothetical protein
VLRYKLRAAALSFTVFLAFASIMAWVAGHFWYPHYLFWLDGGFQGLRLVYAVDFVLGPLLAMVFFHPEKSRGKLIFDIVFVGCIQFSAMAWGGYQVYKERPVAVVYGSGRFVSVATHIMALQHKTPESLQVFSEERPPYVYRREPQGDVELMRQHFMLMKQGLHFEAQAWLFEPFADNADKVFANQDKIRAFVAGDTHLQAAWTQWSDNHPAGSDWRLAFYEGRYANALLIFSGKGVYQDYLRLGDSPLPDIGAATPGNAASSDAVDGGASVDKAH